MTYDLAIIGGGPAGLMAASSASELGTKVIIIEKNKQPGIKLLLTGNGRCNLTNKINNNKILASHYGPNGKFLLSGFAQFNDQDTIDYFEARGVKIKVEDNNRVLPVSNRASEVLDALLKDLKNKPVTIKNNSRVTKIISKNNIIQKIIINDQEEIIAKNYLIAVGGKSYPLTGSTGDGYTWLKNLEHTIIEPKPALTPIILKEKFINSLEGLSFKDKLITIRQNNILLTKETGDFIFTANSISGPAIINLSRLITDRLIGTEKVIIDFFPQQTEKELNLYLQQTWATQQNKTIKNALTELLPEKFIEVILPLIKINLAKKINSITREERKRLIELLKEFTLEIKKLADFNQAMITKGGVKINEINPKTMRSKIVDNLYLAGEIIDLDGPTGGYNLQICWTTGYVAGKNAI
jgi:predicted Rossmann fold flavoprotein